MTYVLVPGAGGEAWYWHLVAPLLDDAIAAARRVLDAARAGDAHGALVELGAFRLLCAHRRGPYGVAAWGPQIEGWLAADAAGFSADERWYVGRPLLVTANDYALGVYNGDAGVVVRGDEGPRVVVAGAFGRTDFATSRMSDVETMYATTIHKSQGSQAGEVTVLLPPPASRLLTRELFYTAVTRAMDRVRVVGTEESVRAAVERRAQRASGLRRRLAGQPGTS